MPALKQLAVLTLALSAILVQRTSALAAECNGVQFSDTVNVADKALVLNGMGIRKATFVQVKVYVAGLYVTQKSSDGQQIAEANQPWELLLRFVRSADASDVRDAFTDGFKKVAGNGFEALRARVDALNAQIVDFKEGGSLSYAYDPAKGTLVSVNGSSGALIPGTDFASALLLISIGRDPPNKDLKTGLLGGKCE